MSIPYRVCAQIQAFEQRVTAVQQIIDSANACNQVILGKYLQ